MGNTFPLPFKYCASYLVCGGQGQVLAIGTLLQVQRSIAEFALLLPPVVPFEKEEALYLLVSLMAPLLFSPFLHFDLCCRISPT